MIEIMTAPGWKVAETPLSRWVDRFAEQGLKAVVTRESPDVSWIEIAALRLRGYALIEGRHVEAINFELSDPDPLPARLALERAAAALGWELVEDDDEDDDDRPPPDSRGNNPGYQ